MLVHAYQTTRCHIPGISKLKYYNATSHFNSPLVCVAKINYLEQISLTLVRILTEKKIVIIIIIIVINFNWVFTRWQWLIYMYTIATKFTSGGPHEKHVVAIWNRGNHLSICF
jgi:hypothetical protein